MNARSLIKLNFSFYLTLFMNLIAPLSNIIFALTIKGIVDAGVQHNTLTLINNLIICSGAIVTFVVCNYWAQHLASSYASQQIYRYRQLLMKQILQLSYVTFQQNNSSNYQHWPVSSD